MFTIFRSVDEMMDRRSFGSIGNVVMFVLVVVGAVLFVGCSSSGNPLPPKPNVECYTNDDCDPGLICSYNGQCVPGNIADGDKIDLDIDDSNASESEVSEDGDTQESDIDGDVAEEESNTEDENEVEEEIEINPDFRIVFQNPKDGDFLPLGEVNVKVLVISTSSVVENVVFSANGQEIGTDSVEPYQLTWDTSGLDEGDYVLSAVAHRMDGEVAEAHIVVSIDLSPPVVNITSPEPGSVFYYDDEMMVTVEAYDHLKQLVISIDNLHPYTLGEDELAGETIFNHIIPMTLDYVTKGPHQLVVIASDKAGNAPTTSTVPFVVDNIPPDISVSIKTGDEWSDLPPGLSELMGSQQMKIVVEDLSAFRENSSIRFTINGEAEPFFSEDLGTGTHYELLINWDEFVPEEYEYPYNIAIELHVTDRFGNQASFNRSFAVKREVFTVQPDTQYNNAPYETYSAPAITPEGSWVVAAINNTMFATTIEDGAVYWECTSPCEGQFCKGASIYAPITTIEPSSGIGFAITIDEDGNFLVHDLISTAGGHCPNANVADMIESSTGISGLTFIDGIAVGEVESVDSEQALPLFVCGTKEDTYIPDNSRVVCARLNFFFQRQVLPSRPAPIELAWTYIAEGVYTTTAPLYVNTSGISQLFVVAGSQIVDVDISNGSGGNSYFVGADIALSPVVNLEIGGVFTGGGSNYAHLSLNLGNRDNLIAPIAGKTLEAYSSLITADGLHILVLREVVDNMAHSVLKAFSINGTEFENDPVFSFDLESRHEAEATPVIGNNNMLYIADKTQAGVFIAYSLESHQMLWKLNVGDRVRCPLVMDTRGVVYFTARDGYLHAISSGSTSYDRNAIWPMFGGNPQHTFNKISQ